MENKLKEWKEIKSDFVNYPILLGNGFSLNFCQKLHYNSLHSSFIEQCSPYAKKLFETFNTQNFEIVLKNLEIAGKVNSALGNSNNDIDNLKNEIRNGLIQAIGSKHPLPEDISFERLDHVSLQLNDFCDIFTTNYDIYLYYLVLRTGRFGDFYWSHWNNDFTEFMDFDDNNGYHIYYLHGALFLFGDYFGNRNYKVRTRENYLLEAITGQIQFGNYPIFISEGTSDSKLNQIYMEPYLRFCYDELCSKNNKKITVYGHSLGEQDKHIVDAIDENYTDVAIGIKADLFNGPREIENEIHRISQYFKNANPVFFNSTSLFSFEEKVGNFTKVYGRKY